mgnify:CR=1 FL=1
MRYCGFFLLFILLLGVAGLFFIKKPDGQTWLSAAAFMSNTAVWTARFNGWLHSAGREVARGIGGTSNAGKTKVYQWRDNAGNWHVSNQPITAAGGRDEIIYVDPDTNLIEGTH